MKHKKKITLFVMFLLGVFSGLQAQNLDRISISSGGSSTNEVNYVIGETFNFALANGNITIESGSQSSTNNTGNNYASVEQITNQYMVYCYPNPAKDIIYFNLKGNKTKELLIQIFDLNGKLLMVNQTIFSEIMSCKIQDLSVGMYLLTISDKYGKVFGASKFIKIK